MLIKRCPAPVCKAQQTKSKGKAIRPSAVFMSNWHLYLGELLLPGRVPEPAAPITKATSAADLGPGPLQCCLRGLLCLLGAGQPARPQPFASSAGRSCRGSYLWDSLSAGISLHSLWLNSRYFAFRTSSSHTFNRDAKAG